MCACAWSGAHGAPPGGQSEFWARAGSKNNVVPNRHIELVFMSLLWLSPSLPAIILPVSGDFSFAESTCNPRKEAGQSNVPI